MIPARLLIRYIFLSLLAGWGVYGAFHPQAFWILDGINLALHEAGHPLFGLFGEFIGFLGGTLMQLLMPAAFMFEFARRGDRFSAAVIQFWLGENFFHIAPYIRDARSQALPLVGGGEHDWGYLLGKLNCLNWDHQIANAFWVVGFSIIILSIFLAFRYANEYVKTKSASSI